MIAPCGTYTKPRRGATFAAVFPCATRAGTIASRNGSATVAPSPFSSSRRAMCRFVMNIAVLSPSVTGNRILNGAVGGGLMGPLHPKRRTLHDTHHDRREAIVRRRRVAHDLTDDGHVFVGEAA